MLGSKLIDHPL